MNSEIKNIEVIIIPSEEDEVSNKNDFQKILESGPTFSIEEINNIKKVGENSHLLNEGKEIFSNH